MARAYLIGFLTSLTAALSLVALGLLAGPRPLMLFRVPLVLFLIVVLLALALVFLYLWKKAVEEEEKREAIERWAELRK